MTMNEKEKLAKKIYKELGFEIEEFQTEKVEEIDADVFLPINNQRGIGTVIIGEDGTYHVCGSRHKLQHYIDEYKNGIRKTIERDKIMEEKINDDNDIKKYKVELKIHKNQSEKSNEIFKLTDEKYATDLETKEAFDNYMNKVKKYKEQIAKGETTNVKLVDLLNEYTDTFYDEELEKKSKKNEENFNNREKDTEIDELMKRIDKKINEINNKTND